MIQFLFIIPTVWQLPGNGPGAAKIRYHEKATELNPVAS